MFTPFGCGTGDLISTATRSLEMRFGSFVKPMRRHFASRARRTTRCEIGIQMTTTRFDRSEDSLPSISSTKDLYRRRTRNLTRSSAFVSIRRGPRKYDGAFLRSTRSEVRDRLPRCTSIRRKWTTYHLEGSVISCQRGGNPAWKAEPRYLGRDVAERKRGCLNTKAGINRFRPFPLSIAEEPG